MNKKQLLTIRIGLVLLVLVFIFLVFNFTKKVKHFDEYNEYFHQPPDKQQVQSWMTFHQIGREYHIDIKKALGKNAGFFDMKKPVSEYCTKAKIDCNELIKKLNEIKNHGN